MSRHLARSKAAHVRPTEPRSGDVVEPDPRDQPQSRATTHAANPSPDRTCAISATPEPTPPAPHHHVPPLPRDATRGSPSLEDAEPPNLRTRPRRQNRSSSPTFMSRVLPNTSYTPTTRRKVGCQQPPLRGEVHCVGKSSSALAHRRPLELADRSAIDAIGVEMGGREWVDSDRENVLLIVTLGRQNDDLSGA